MTNERINTVLAQLKEYNAMKKELEDVIAGLQAECKDYMVENNLYELFNDDNSIVARYSEVISNRFDSSAFKKSEWRELYAEFTKQIKSMRFTIN
jgi:hypothetical protein